VFKRPNGAGPGQTNPRPTPSSIMAQSIDAGATHREVFLGKPRSWLLASSVPAMVADDLNTRMARIVRDVRSGDDVGQAGDRICAAAVELLGGQAEAGITVAHRNRRVENIGATSAGVQRGDDLQAELGEGPCLDAAWDHEQVVAVDLANDTRWPRWGPTMAREHGIRSMLSTRLFTAEKQLGALNVYSTVADAFDQEDQEIARVLAVHAAVAVAAAQQVDGLRLAADRRTTIGKALGIIMVRYRLDDDAAFSVLRRLSSHENRKLFDVAQEVVSSGRLPSKRGGTLGGGGSPPLER
jgi:GAF domain-containing protein